MAIYGVEPLIDVRIGKPRPAIVGVARYLVEVAVDVRESLVELRLVAVEGVNLPVENVVHGDNDIRLVRIGLLEVVAEIRDGGVVVSVHHKAG